MPKAWLEAVLSPAWTVGLFTIGCQLLTGASERHLVSQVEPDSGSVTGGATAAGGASGSAGSTGSGGLGGAGSTGSGGSAGSTGSGGFSDAGADTADVGTNPDSTVRSCPEGYIDWFQSSFAAADRDVVGSVDFPAMPWATWGNLKILSGRLSGNGTASASQGLAFGYEGLRLRFKGRFSDSSQHVKVALNAQDNGSGGLQIDVAASGKVLLLENHVERGSATLNPLAIDRDWFVEAELGASRATVRLSDTNYAGQAGASVLATIENAPLANAAVEKRLSMALTSAGDLAAAVDELFVARCGLAPPEYQPIFKDAFERPDSSVLGNADLPPTSTWTSRSPDVSIGRGDLYFSGSTSSSATAPIVSELVNDAIRLRFAFHTNVDLSQFSLIVTYNSSYVPVNPPGVHLTSDAISTTVAFGDTYRVHAFTIAIRVSHYAQLDAQGGNGVFTLRTGGSAGPILAIQAGPGLTDIPNTLQDIVLTSKREVAIEEIEFARYAP